MQTESQTNCTHNADSGQHQDGFDVLFDEGHIFVFGGANVLLNLDVNTPHEIFLRVYPFAFYYLTFCEAVNKLFIPAISEIIYPEESYHFLYIHVSLIKAAMIEEVFF